MTAIVRTENSEYVVVSRPEFGVTVVRSNGTSTKGGYVALERGYMVLRDDTFRALMTTSTVVAIHILTN